MADIASSSSVLPKDDKPVIVRVKRKASHSPLEALWLEINERPLKRPLLDFEKLSISDSSGKVEALKPKKVFVQHVETISSSEDTSNFNFLKLFEPKSVDGNESKAKNKELRRTFKTENKQDQLLVKAKQKHEALSKNARFEQIWRTRKGEKDAMRDHGALHEMCHVYDVVRVDVVDTTIEANEQEDMDFEDHRIMSSYLPLLREFIPSAAAEIESDIHDYVSKQASKDDYVYDLYTVKDDVNTSEEDASNPFPLVQVDDDDEFYDGPITSDNESDDSNAEDNPLNDYPDKETSEDDDKHGGSRTSKSNDESEELDSASASSKSEDLEHQNWSEDADPFYEGYICGHDGGDGDYYDDDGGGDNDEWKWSYR